jgi:endo-1,4-beta-xylanase
MIGNRWNLVEALLVGLAFLCTTGSAFATPVLRDLAPLRGIEIRAAAAEGALLEDPIFPDALRTQFNAATPELSLLFKYVHPAADTYDFWFSDYMIDFAETNGLASHGHTLVWHTALPSWLTAETWTRDELIAIMEDHIKTVVGRYRGRIKSWEVVNEAFRNDGTMWTSFWYRGIGSDYIDLAFQFAHEADPDAKLFYKDYSVGEEKADAIYEMVSGMLQRGVPLDGVGIQIHVAPWLDTDGLFDVVAANMRRLHALGLETNITEFEVMLALPPTADALAGQADIYAEAMQLCLCAPGCKVFETWGVTDKYSWIPDFLPGFGASLLSDEAYNPKPAFFAVADVLEQFHDADGDGVRDDNGECTRIQNPCPAGQTEGCYDNCPDVQNLGQEDGSCEGGIWQASVPDGTGNACQDSDGDGATDRDELLAQTNPCAGEGDPVADIEVNGLDAFALIPRNSAVEVTIALDPGGHAGELADWGSSLIFYHATAGWIPVPLTSFQAPLLHLPAQQIFSAPGLPAGIYIFTFGVDLNPNGILDVDQMYSDSTAVIVY